MSPGSIAVPEPVTAALAAAPAGPSGRAARAAARTLSERYRAGAGSEHGTVVRDAAELAAYGVARFPATYAAAVAAFTAAAAVDPDFVPASLLDVGSGLGATACAAVAVWPSLATVTCIEPDRRAGAAGPGVVGAAAAPAARPTVDWVVADAAAAAGRTAELVTAGYVGNELADPVGFARLLWTSTTGLLVLVEPGRRTASHALLASRAALHALGATTTAPCPHDERCPLPQSDWCHFGQRLPRTAAHRRLKDAELPYEDEKYSYVALSRRPPSARPARVIRRPVRRKGLVELPLCTATGLRPERVPRSDPRYRAAKDAGWGDGWADRQG